MRAYENFYIVINLYIYLHFVIFGKQNLGWFRALGPQTMPNSVVLGIFDIK